MNWYYFRNSSEKFIRFLEKEYFIIQEKEFTKKFDIGRTNFWPLEYDDIVRKMTLKLTITLELCVCCKELELIYYLFGLDCDIEERCLSVLSETIKNCTP